MATIINRRSFLSAFSGMAVAMALDPERLLWRPGAKMISVPNARSRLDGMDGGLVSSNLGLKYYHVGMDIGYSSMAIYRERGIVPGI